MVKGQQVNVAENIPTISLQDETLIFSGGHDLIVFSPHSICRPLSRCSRGLSVYVLCVALVDDCNLSSKNIEPLLKIVIGFGPPDDIIQYMVREFPAQPSSGLLIVNVI